MARKRGKPAAAHPAGRPVLKHFVRVVLTLLLSVSLVTAVMWFGSKAGEEVAGHPRYAVPFASVQCDAPPGGSRDAFLNEVRYLGDLPEAVQVVGPKAEEALAAAFARHPWVEAVEGVDVDADRRVRVRLKFRVPVLLVKVAGGVPPERLVDAAGVLLPPVPADKRPEGVAVLANEQTPPSAAAGQVWDGPVVKRAAELAKEFRATRIERTDKGWRVTQAGGRVLSVSW